MSTTFSFSLDEIKKHFPEHIRKKLPKNIAVIFLSEEKSRRINKRFCNKDKPTNILSFRYDRTYAELLLCKPVIRREAKKMKHSYHQQMTWMIVHGMLHIAGMHHEASARMENRVDATESRILRSLSDSSLLH